MNSYEFAYANTFAAKRSDHNKWPSKAVARVAKPASIMQFAIRTLETRPPIKE